MGLNKSSGNMYSFVTHTFNTIKGKCPHDCAYCYMKRFKQNKVRLDTKEFRTDLGKGNFIFVGSSCKDAWIKETLEYCRSFPDNKYLFQSKNLGVMLDWIDDFPPNSIIGTTIETNRFYSDYMGKTPLSQSRAVYMNKISKMYPTMITIEPIMAFKLDVLVNLIRGCQPQWVNVGADSQGHKLPEPTAIEVEALIAELKKFTEVKVKKNLKRLVGFKAKKQVEMPWDAINELGDWR